MPADLLHDLADRLDPPTVDAFELLGYQPNCKPRTDAAKAGIWPLPPFCGHCPQERFHAAVAPHPRGSNQTRHSARL